MVVNLPLLDLHRGSKDVSNEKKGGGCEQHCDDNIHSLWNFGEESGSASEAISSSLETSARDEHLIACLPCGSWI